MEGVDHEPSEHFFHGPPGGRARTRVPVVVATVSVVAVVLVALLFPAMRRWWRADTAVDATTMRFATVTRGDLCASCPCRPASSRRCRPTLFSPGQGIVALRTRAGAQVQTGRRSSPPSTRSELPAALEQSRAPRRSHCARSSIARRSSPARRSSARGSRSTLLGVRARGREARSSTRSQRTFKEGSQQQAPTRDRAGQRPHRDDGARAGPQGARAARARRLASTCRRASSRSSASSRSRCELQKRVDDLTIRAPFDGMVATVAVQDRDAVAPNQAVLTVVNLVVAGARDRRCPRSTRGRRRSGRRRRSRSWRPRLSREGHRDLAGSRQQPGRGHGRLRRRAAAGTEAEPAPDDDASSSSRSRTC